MPFDLSERGVERGIRPMQYVRHGFKGVALRLDRELMGGVLPDVPHRATKQVRQAPDWRPLSDARAKNFGEHKCVGMREICQQQCEFLASDPTQDHVVALSGLAQDISPRAARPRRQAR
jgi:hypothetical protein